MRTHSKYILVMGVVAALAGTAGTALAQALPAPDVIFHGGKVFTGLDTPDFVEAVAVRDGRVVAVGSSAGVLRLADSKTRKVDLGGKTVVPGFYDNHAHIGGGEGRDTSVRNWMKIGSTKDLLDAMRRRAAEVPPGQWIRAGLSTELLPEQLLPTRRQMDEVTPNHPIALERMHVLLVNSRSLALAGITRETPQPPGGEIGHDANGEPNGILRESPAHRMVERLIPVPNKTPDPAAERAGVRRSFENLLTLGITSVNVPGIRPQELGLFQDVYKEDKAGDLPRATLQIRINAGFDTYDDLEEAARVEIGLIDGIQFHTGIGNDRVKLGAIKMSIDGGMTGQASWLTRDYKGKPGFRGTVRIPEQQLYRIGKAAHDRGWQLGIHAIGDAGVEATVRVLARILKESPRADARHYVHHIEVSPSEQTFQTMAQYGIMAAMQPNFTYSLAPYYQNALGTDQLPTVNPQVALTKRGIKVSYGSDGLPLGPLIGIYGAVTRKGVDGKVYGPEERISVKEAVRLYTAGSAYQTFDENNRGTLETGKYADMTVLSGDIFTMDPEGIKDVRALQTIIGGRTVWSATAATQPTSDQR